MTLSVARQLSLLSRGTNVCQSVCCYFHINTHSRLSLQTSYEPLCRQYRVELDRRIIRGSLVKDVVAFSVRTPFLFLYLRTLVSKFRLVILNRTAPVISLITSPPTHSVLLVGVCCRRLSSSVTLQGGAA